MALALMNDPVYVEFAKSLADRILRDAPTVDVETRITYGFRLAMARQPNPSELKRFVAIYQRELKLNHDHPAAAKVKLAGASPPNGVDAAQWAAWYYIASLLMNLDETITKG